MRDGVLTNKWKGTIYKVNMHIKKVSILSLAIAIILFSIPACNLSQVVKDLLPPGKGISFEHFSISDYYHRSEKTAQIWVIDSLQQYNRPEGIEWDPPSNNNQPEPPPEISTFDFSQYFILMVFNGYRANYGEPMKIKGIRQDKGTVNIWIHLDDNPATVIPVYSSQYNVLQISREEMTQFGEITFKLIDQNGQERATATYEVSN
jgi:hypothetical protein